MEDHETNMSKSQNRTVTIGNATYEITRVFAGKKTAAELIGERLMEEIGKTKDPVKKMKSEKKK